MRTACLWLDIGYQMARRILPLHSIIRLAVPTIDSGLTGWHQAAFGMFTSGVNNLPNLCLELVISAWGT